MCPSWPPVIREISLNSIYRSHLESACKIHLISYSNEMNRHVFKNETSKHRVLKIKGFVTTITKEAVSYTFSVFEKRQQF